MAAYTLLCRIATSGTRSSSFLHATRGCFTSHSTTINTKTLLIPPFQARSYANSASIFDEQNQKKYYIFGGKGGVGKTSCAASLAVKFADRGHPTVLVSTNNTPSLTLSDSFDEDLTDGGEVFGGLKSPLYAREINPDAYTKNLPGVAGLMDRMYTLGLGKLVEHLGESGCEKLLGRLTSCLNEAVEILRVMKWAESPPACSFYTRLVLDTSSKGDDLLHHFKSDSEIRDRTKAISSLIENGMFRESIEDMKRTRELISGSTEYVIMTAPTVMGVLESSQLHASIKEKVLVRRLIVNEIPPPFFSRYFKFSSMKSEDEIRAFEMIKNDPELGNLDLIKAPLVDGEIIRGIAALKSLGDVVWK